MKAALVNRSSHQMAIDGQVIGNVSAENDLSAKGYKFRKDSWQICNCKKSILTLFEQLHTPMSVDLLPT